MQSSKRLGSVLLVSGTAIGAGMLALPIATAQAGFVPSALIFTLCSVLTTLSALLLLEVNLALPAKADLITMSFYTLGKKGKYFACIIYLLLLYALSSAYIKISSNWLFDALQANGLNHVSFPLCIFIVNIILGTILYFGTKIVDRINRILALGLLVSYCVLVSKTLPYIKLQHLQQIQFLKTIPALPLMMTSFGFAIVVPSLTDYLQRNKQSLFFAIVWGNLLTLGIYLLWELVTLATMPLEGQHGLLSLMSSKQQEIALAVSLEYFTHNHWITTAAHLFSVFAVLTSFLGVSLSLFHFLADGLKNTVYIGKNRFLLICVTFLPSTLMTVFYPTAFSRLLSISGIFVALLLGILPACMAWVGRYRLKLIHTHCVPGGKFLLIIINVFFFFIIIQEIYNCILQ